VSYSLLNSSAPPFDDITARQAAAYATDFDELNAIIGHDLMTAATGPFAPGNVGHLDDTGFPTFDLDRAKDLVSQYENETGEPLRFSYTTTQAEGDVRSAQLLKEQWEAAGMQVEIVTVDQSTQIHRAITGDYQAMAWRNHPGGDPDMQYVWWQSTYPTNFGRIEDPAIDDLLTRGRTTAVPDRREQIYENLNRRFGEQVYNLWMASTLWSVATAPLVHGIDADAGLAVGHPVETLWVEH
jgi:peptide/nickel transport system substrate-binding protein